MKTKILLLAFLFFTIGISFAQTTYNWGNWVTSPCFSGISYRVKCTGKMNNNSGLYGWDIEFRNSYSRSVWFYVATGDNVQDLDNEIIDLKVRSVTLSPNSTGSGGYIDFKNGCNSTIMVAIGKLQFKKTNSNSWETFYAECDKGGGICYLCSKKPTTGCPNVDKSNSEANTDPLTKYENKTNSNNQQAEQQENQRIVEENQRRAEEERQKKFQAQQELVNISVNATTDLINYFANRKNALRNSLSSEDAKALLAIVNSENPADYTQNIIQIFTDLGYTHRKTDKKEETTYIFLNNDIHNINDFMMISIHPANKYDDYNSISFSYHRRKKLLEQLSTLGSNLKGFNSPEIKGISPSREKKVEQEKQAEGQKKIELAKNKVEFEKNTPQKLNKELESNITAQYVVAEHIKTIGGLEKLKSINNIIQTIENEKGTFKSIVAHGKILNKGISDGNSYKSVFNGTTGYSEWNGNKIEMDKKMISQYQKNQPIFILKFQQNSDLELKGIEQFRERECYAVSEKSNVNEVSIIHTYYFDTKSFELLGIEFLSNATNYQNKSYLLYDDYREVDGISFAFTQTSVSQNSTIINKTKELLLNQPISDKDFE